MLEEKESIVALAMSLASLHEIEGPFSGIYETLEGVEQLIFHHKDAFGVGNVQFQQGLEEFLLLCNTAAIQHLQHVASDHQVSQCGELLNRAEQHTRRSGYLRTVDGHPTNRPHLRVLTLNNLACYNKQIKKPLAAIGFLEKVLEIQLREYDTSDGRQGSLSVTECIENAIALTHLNLCAVLSQMRRHDAAAQHARSAIDILDKLQRSDAHESMDWNLLLVAHYNLAVEMEHLRNTTHSIATCEKGLAIAKQRQLDRTSNDVVRMLEEMGRSQRVGHGIKSPRSLSPRNRPVSPRSLRQK